MRGARSEKLRGNFRAGGAVDVGMRRGMRRVLSFVLAGVAAVVGIATVETPARAADSADECVSLQSAALTTGLALDVQNSCSKRLTCAVSWTLSCQNASGQTTSKAKQEARFVIDASDTHHTTGSAASCKDSWKIEDVSWGCAPVGK